MADDACSFVKIAPASTSSPEGLCGNESAALCAFKADRKRLAAAAIDQATPRQFQPTGLPQLLHNVLRCGARRDVAVFFH